eukprot:5487502-Pyramimonas_sp.AAC.2
MHLQSFSVRAWSRADQRGARSGGAIHGVAAAPEVRLEAAGEEIAARLGAARGRGSSTLLRPATAWG